MNHSKLKFCIAIILCLVLVFSVTINSTIEVYANPLLLGLSVETVKLIGACLVAGGLVYANRDSLDRAIDWFVEQTSSSVLSEFQTNAVAVVGGIATVSSTMWDAVRSFNQTNFVEDTAQTVNTPFNYYDNYPVSTAYNNPIPLLTFNSHGTFIYTINSKEIKYIASDLAGDTQVRIYIDSSYVTTSYIKTGTDFESYVCNSSGTITLYLHFTATNNKEYHNAVSALFTGATVDTGAINYDGTTYLNQSDYTVDSVAIKDTIDDYVNLAPDQLIADTQALTYTPPMTYPWEEENTINFPFPWEVEGNEDGITYPWEVGGTGDITNPYEEPVTIPDGSVDSDGTIGIWEWLKNLYNLVKNGILGFLKMIIDALKWVIMALISGINAIIENIMSLTDIPRNWIPKIPPGITNFFSSLIALILALMRLFGIAIIFIGDLYNIPATTSMINADIITGIEWARGLTYNGVNLYGLVMGISNVILFAVVFKLIRKIILGIGSAPKSGKDWV